MMIYDSAFLTRE